MSTIWSPEGLWIFPEVLGLSDFKLFYFYQKKKRTTQICFIKTVPFFKSAYSTLQLWLEPHASLLLGGTGGHLAIDKHHDMH